jgi:hypothetical protein
MAELESETAENTRLDLWVALNYGGRAEIVDAARRLVEDGVPAEEVDEDALASRLYAPELPDPDLLIRTSGEVRTVELPALAARLCRARLRRHPLARLRGRDLRAALDEYARRGRRFGGAEAALKGLRQPARRRAGGRPVVLGAIWLGGWWLFALVLAGDAGRAARVLRDGAPLRPLVLAGYGGGRDARRARSSAAWSGWSAVSSRRWCSRSCSTSSRRHARLRPLR